MSYLIESEAKSMTPTRFSHQIANLNYPPTSVVGMGRYHNNLCPRWPPAILFYRCSLDLILFFRRLISEVAWPIVTKLCHMFDGDQDL